MSCKDSFLALSKRFKSPLHEMEIDAVIKDVQGRAANYMQDGVARSDAYDAAQRDIMEDARHDLSAKRLANISTLLKFEPRYKVIDEAFKDKGIKGVYRRLKELTDASLTHAKGEGLSLQNAMLNEQHRGLGVLRSILMNYKKQSGQDFTKLDGGDLGSSILYARQQVMTKNGERLKGHVAPKPLDEHNARLGREIFELQEDLVAQHEIYGNRVGKLPDYIHGNQWDRNLIMKNGRPGKLERDLKSDQYIKALGKKGNETFRSPEMKRLSHLVLDREKWADFLGEGIGEGNDSTARAFVYWLSDMKNLLDMSKSLEEIPPYKVGGRELTDEKIKGLYQAFRNLTNPKQANIRKERTAAQVDRSSFINSRNRKLHFLDPQSTEESTKRWGGMTTQDAIVKDINNMSGQLGMLKFGGGSLNQGFGDLLNYVNEKYSSPETNKLTNLALVRFNEAVGNVPQEESVVNTVVQYSMMMQNMMKLGLVTFSSLPDVATMSSALSGFQRRNVFNLLRQHTIGTAASIPPNMFGAPIEESAMNKIYSMIGTGAEYLSSDLASNARIGDTSILKGGLNKLNAGFFKYAGLFRHDTQLWKLFVTMALHGHGMESGLKFGELPSYMQRAMGRFNIQDKEWNFYRQFTQKDTKGRNYIDITKFNPDNSENIAKELQSYNPSAKTPFQREMATRELYDRYLMMLHDGMRQSVVTPSPATRYYLHGSWLNRKNIATGSPMGSIMSLFAQYKNFPMQLMRVPLSGMVHSAKAGDYYNILNYGISSMMYNYLSWGMKSMLSLKTWPSFENMKDNKTQAQSFMKNVMWPSFGFVGEMLSEENKDGSTLLDNLMGPTGSTMENLFNDMQLMINGDLTKNDMIYTSSQFLPTTFPILGSMIKMMLESMKDAPSQRRAQHRMMQEDGQQYFNQ